MGLSTHTFPKGGRYPTMRYIYIYICVYTCLHVYHYGFCTTDRNAGFGNLLHVRVLGPLPHALQVLRLMASRQNHTYDAQ